MDIVQELHEFRTNNVPPRTPLGHQLDKIQTLQLIGKAILEIEQLRAKLNPKK